MVQRLVNHLYQPPLFVDLGLHRPVNVSSVPLRSPFRYPGGKTWFVPYIKRWLNPKPRAPLFIEPFAGGGIISLTVAAEDLAEHVMMVERDKDVAAVWEVILGDGGQWLADQITQFDMTSETVEALLSRQRYSTRQRAFATIVKNRVNHGGVLAPRAGRLNRGEKTKAKNGEHSKGLLSRWYPETLSTRILNIVAMRECIDFIQGDGIRVMREHAYRTDAVYFIDPPYVAAGKRLYKHSALDHERLFRTAKALAGDFLMTYDDADEVRRLAQKYDLDTLDIPLPKVNNTHHEERVELLIGRDLTWARK